MSDAVHLLRVEKGRSKGRAVRLPASGEVVVGRDQGNALVVSDPQASRRHFKVQPKGQGYELQDLSSSNGTWVNGLRVETVELLPGDKIQLGDTIVYYLVEKELDESARRGPLTGKELCGYRIGRLLGRGGMGTVYEAVQSSLERTVAFKVLAPELASDPQFIERFVAEARAAGRLSHANIVAVYDVGQDGDTRFYSMEYMAGGSLDDLLRREGRLSVARSIPLVFDAARGLEFAEKHGVIHRDIKPDNLMLGVDDVLKICDLGIATHPAGAAHEVSGSPLYIAPEHAQGLPFDHRVDLYSLGVTWYQILAGETPFSGPNAREIIRKHVSEAPPPLQSKASDVPDDAARLVMRLLAKDPAERVPSARQLQADLLELARRYPIRETVMLRLDALAPDLAPSAVTSAAAGTAPTPIPALASADPAAPVGPRAPAPGPAAAAPAGVPGPWRRRLLVLAVVLLGLAAFLTASRSLRRGREAAAQQASDEVAALRERLEAGELQVVLDEAPLLAARLRESGWAALASEARGLGTQALERQRRQAEEEAARRLGDVRRLYDKPGPRKPGAETIARLEELGARLAEVVREFPGTEAAGQAEEQARQVDGELADLRKGEREKAERRDAVRRALERTKKDIDALLRLERRDRFREASQLARQFQQDYGREEPVGAEALLQSVLERARRALDTQVEVARQLAIQQDWDGARVALSRLGPELGDPRLDQELEQELGAIDEAEQAARRADQEARVRADRVRLERALGALEDKLRQRRFDEVASLLAPELPQLVTGESRRRLEARVDRLRGAARSLARLAEQVRAQREPRFTLPLDFPGLGSRQAVASEVDERGRRYTFQLDKHVLRDVEVDDEAMQPQRVLEFLARLPLRPQDRVDLACLAYELKRRAFGERLLVELPPAEDAVQRRARELLSLAQE